MNYLLGAYYLLKIKPLKFGALKGKKVLTGSSCVNESYFNSWSLSWTEDGKNDLSIPIEEFNLNKENVQEIQLWADEEFNKQNLGWVNTFSNLKTLLDYKKLFFSTEKNIVALGIYFEEKAGNDIISEFSSKTKSLGEIGIVDTLKKNILELENQEEIFIGYDLIGIEFSGDFHSFHCYDISEKLLETFNVKLNEYGLIDELENKTELLEYANNPDNGLPFIPWSLVMVKQIQ